MKLSIIVPCFNAENTISKCVESLVMSSYSDKEIILIDDGSTDNTKEIIEQYSIKYSYIHAYSKDNEGLGKTRNYGIKVCTGDLVTFIDSDDYIHPEAFSKMIGKMLEFYTDAVYCGFIYVFGEKLKTDVFDCEEVYRDSTNFIKYILNEKRCFAGLSACTGIYKKNILNTMAGGPFLSEREFLSEDKLFNVMYLSKANRVAITRDSFYYYVQHSEGTISTTFKDYKIQAAYNMCTKLLDAFKDSELKQYILIDYLVNLSACFHQLCMDKAVSISSKLKIIKKTINNSKFIDVLKMLDVKEVGLKFRLLYFLILNKRYFSICALYIANRKRG